MKRRNTKFNSPLNYLFSSVGLYVMYALFVILGSLMVVNEAHSQTTNTWDGSTDNVWSTASNWSLNTAPSSAHDIVIDIDATIEVNSGAFLTINSLTITSSATVSMTALTSDRKITIDNTGNSIDSGCSLTLKGSSSSYFMKLEYTGSSNTMVIDGSLTLTSDGEGGQYDASNSLTTVNGSLIKDSTGGGTGGKITSTSSNLTFASESYL